jgi:hypothetical protein
MEGSKNIPKSDTFGRIIEELKRKDVSWNGVATELVRTIRSRELSHGEYSVLAAIEIAIIGEELANISSRLDKLDKASKNILFKVTS